MNTFKDTTPNHHTLVSSTHDQRPTPMQKNVAPFLNKVYNMVNDPSSDEHIRWSTDGKSFFVVRHEDFARSVLPRFFKHSNFSSFVRQLNMYGFHKVPHLQNGVLHADNESEQWEFSNPHFQRNQPDLLLLVTRKKGRETDEKEAPATNTNTNIDLQRILEEIQVIKQHQMNISSQLKNIQNDNSILWQETISARERHQRHQETIDKILRFLASVFSNDKSVAIPRKRRYLLEAPDKDHQDIEHRQQEDNNNQDNGRPSKVQKTGGMPEFRLEDYVPSLKDPSIASSIVPTSQSLKSTNPTSELDDAIAFNDKSKQSSSTPSWIYPISLPQDLTQVMNNQQLQGLQSLIGLAQSHPALLSQLTNDVLNTYHHGNSTTNNNNNNNNNNAQSTTSTPSTEYALPDQTFDHNVSNTLINNAVAMIHSLPNTTTQHHHPPPPPSTTTNSTENQSRSNDATAINNEHIPLSQPINPTSDPQKSTHTKPSLPQISSNIQTLARTADDINTDIDTLGSNIEALAHQLGFDPTKPNDDLLGYVDMDKFLQVYGANDDSTFNNLDSIYPSETISPSTTTPASPNTDSSNI